MALPRPLCLTTTTTSVSTSTTTILPGCVLATHPKTRHDDDAMAMGKVKRTGMEGGKEWGGSSRGPVASPFLHYLPFVWTQQCQEHHGKSPVKGIGGVGSGGKRCLRPFVWVVEEGAGAVTTPACMPLLTPLPFLSHLLSPTSHTHSHTKVAGMELREGRQRSDEVRSKTSSSSLVHACVCAAPPAPPLLPLLYSLSSPPCC